ncbi:MAG: zinc-dependent alcohol dehydrogenase family protein [Phycisphaeraceae bacterium]
MQAVVFPEPGKIEIQNVPHPEPGPEEVLVRTRRAGLCGTDLNIHRGEYDASYPLIPGHELCGEVAAFGENVSGWELGQRVAVDPNLDCGHCDFCRRQQNNHCRYWQGVGITRPGGFADYFVVPARAVYHLPDTVSDTEGAFVEPLSCAVHAMERLAVRPGASALIFGAGPMGLLLAQMLGRNGAGRVVVVDKLEERLELAEEMGATETVLVDAQEHLILKGLEPNGYAIVADATGVPAVVESAWQYLRPYGQYLQFGVTPKNATVPLNPYQLFRHDWTLVGSFALCYDFPKAIALLATQAVDVGPLVSHTLPLTEFEHGFNAFVAGDTLKVQYVPAVDGSNG